MAERSILIRIRIADADKAIAELRRLGIAGEKAGGGLGRGAEIGTRALTGLGQGLQRLDRGLLSTRSLIATLAGGGGIGLMVKSALGAADALQETAQKLGVSTDQLQAWRFAADQTGLGAAALESGLDFLNRKIGEAAAGSAEAAVPFAALGVPLKRLDGETRGAGEVLVDLADRFARIEDPAERARLAVRLFGRGAGTDMTLLLAGGSRGLAEFEARAKALGLVMATDLIDRAGKASDQLDALGAVVRTNFNEGLLRGFIEGFAEFHAAATDPQLIQGVENLGLAIGRAIKPLLENAETIIRVVAALKGAAVGFRLGAAVAGGPGALAGGAVGGVAGAFTPEIFGAIIGGADDAKAEVAELGEEIERLQARLDRGGLSGFARLDIEGQLAAARSEQAALEEQLRFEARLRAPGAEPRARDFGVDPGSVPVVADAAAARKKVSDAEANLKFVESLRLEADTLLMTDRARAVAEAGARLNAAATGAERREVEALAGVIFTTAAARERDAEARRNQLGDDALIAGLAEELRLIKLTDREREAEIALRGLSADATGKQADQVRGLARALFDERKAREDAAKADEEMRRQQEDAARRVEDAVRSLGLTFASAFEDAIVEGKALSDVLRGLEKDVIRLGARHFLTEPLAEGFEAIVKDLTPILASAASAIFGGGGGAPISPDIPAGTLHQGGVVGRDGDGRLVPARAFAHAPRFHDGVSLGLPILSHERPAILEQGEVVLSRRDLAAARRRGDEPPAVTQVINISTPDAASFKRSQSQIAADAMAALRRGMRNL